jgi:ribosomal protein L37E
MTTNEQPLSARQIALRDFLTSYEGGPCKRCGGTRRYTKSSACAQCMINYVQRRRTEWSQKRKDWAAAKRAEDVKRAEAAARALLLQGPQHDWQSDL